MFSMYASGCIGYNHPRILENKELLQKALNIFDKTISLDGGAGGSFDWHGDYDKLRELVNQANEFWIINLSDSSNSFFQCHFGANIYEYWKDGEMLFSSKGGTDEALTAFWKLTN